MVEERLIKALQRIFGEREFDATEVTCSHDEQLIAVLNEIPRSRYRSGYFRGRINVNAIRMALRRLHNRKAYQAGNGLIAARYNGDYWSFRVSRE